MTTHINTRNASWLDAVRRMFSGLFGARPAREEKPRQADPATIPTEEGLDHTLEDTFPASDPPSYTGTSIHR